MLVGQAKAVARQWVSEEAGKLPGYQGAFYHGSANWLPDDAPFPATSDLDVMVVLADPSLAAKPGKFVYRGVLLEVSLMSGDQLRSPELVLGQSHLAGSFRAPGIIADPSGWLTTLQAAVSKDYAKRRWVAARCEHVQERIEAYLRALNEVPLFHDQVACWLFGTGNTTHLLLVAGLENPTVRRRYGATRELLAAYGHLDFYEALLELLGCARMTQARAAQHLAALTEAFDAASAVVTPSSVFAADMSEQGRSVAIDGSRELIARGDQREAVFWMVATYSRCQAVFHRDAPMLKDTFSEGYRDLLGDLGITSLADLRRRGEAVREALPRIWAVAEAIMAANRGIAD
jgi:hypothetical protein